LKFYKTKTKTKKQNITDLQSNKMSLIAGMDNVVEYIKQLEEENKKLKLSNQQYIHMFNAVVKREEEKVDKIEKLEDENLKLRNNTENLKLRQQNRMKDDMMKNMILSLVATPSDDFEYEIKDDYCPIDNRQYNKDVEEYFQKIVKEMNDTDWNDDNNALSLVYEDYNISVLFNDTDNDTDDDN